MVSALAPRSLKLVRETWTKAFAEIRKLEHKVVIRPDSSTDIFKIVGANEDKVRLQIEPVVFHIPEKVHSKRGLRLFVVVEGAIEFTHLDDQDDIHASWFGTRVGYFRTYESEVKHVFGIHFDLDRTIGHPVFHGQMKSHIGFYGDVLKRFPGEDAAVLPTDCVNGVLSNVRLPTAQMDFFSVVLLICSDHLVNSAISRAGTKSRASYERIQEYCGAFRGYRNEHTGLRDMAEKGCVRSHFWYADPD